MVGRSERIAEGERSIAGKIYRGDPRKDLQRCESVGGRAFWKMQGIRKEWELMKIEEMNIRLQIKRIKKKFCNFFKIVHIPQELRIRSRGTERHSASN